jgi:Tol biopolymer transport system component
MRIPRLWYLIAWALLLAACDSGESFSDATLVHLEYRSCCSNARIVRIAADGSHRKVLLEGNIQTYGLFPSPDGRNILYFSYPDQSWFLLPSNGGTAAPFPTPAGAGNPSWSPDGSAIAWLQFGMDFSSRLVVAPPGATDAAPLTPDSLRVASIAWAPNSQQLAICAHDSEVWYRMYVMDRDGGNLHAITPDSMQFIGCRQDWSSSNLIAFFANGSIHAIAPDGTGLRRLPIGPPRYGFIGPVHWSPDGQRLTVPEEYGFLWRYDVESRSSQRLTGRAWEGNPWSPQGEFIAFLTDTLGGDPEYPERFSVVSVERADGRDRKMVSPDTLYASYPAWLNDPS